MEKSTKQDLQEMSVHCKPGDMDFNFTITVGSSPVKNKKKGKGSKKSIIRLMHIFISEINSKADLS